MRVHGYLAFLLGICSTILICFLVMDAQERQIGNDFRRDSEKIARDTSVRMQTYFDILFSIKGMLSVDQQVSREQLSLFIAELNLSQRYPGFQAVQFVRRVPHAGLARYVEAQRHAYPKFALHPQGAGAEHFVIEFTEPVKGNESALGLDLAGLPAHLRALEIGSDDGQIIASPRTRLVQDASGDSGFVARAPVYRQGMPLETVAQRRAALNGFVALVFRVNDLMREVIDPVMLPHIGLTIHDVGYLGEGAAPSKDNLMFDNGGQTDVGRGASLPALTTQTSIVVGRRQWRMAFTGYDGSRYGRDRKLIALIGAAGMVISGLIAAVVIASQRRRLLAEQLRQTLDEQRAFQDSAIVGIGLFAGGLIWRCNRGLEEMMGYGPGRLNGLSSDVLLRRGALAETDPFQCDAASQCLHSELQMVRRDGSAIWCTINGKLLDAGDLSKGCVWVIHDISDRKRTEAALLDTRHGLQHSLAELEQQKSNVELARRDLAAVLGTLKQAQTNLVTSEKMASLGSLVAGIAHELNTPIGNSLLTASALSDMVREFERKVADGGVRRSALDAHLADSKLACSIIAGSLERAADLITSFKQVAVDQTSDQRRSFDLGSVMRDTLATFAAQLRRSNCEVRLDVPAGLYFESYPGSVGQVLSNLLNNALLHAFDGRERGVISIHVEETGQQHATLVFGDDGVGMSSKTLHQVFDPFFTTKMGQGGSGLGMNIVYNIVTGILKGTIDVRSEPGRGTTVTVALPKKAPDHRQENANSLLAPASQVD